MKYPDGQDVRLWDRVRAGSTWRGVVVFSIDTGEFSPQFPKDRWAYLKRGVMIDTSDAGLVHHSEQPVIFDLERRGGPPEPREWAERRTAQLTSPQSEWKSGSGPTVQIGAVNRHGQICTGHRGIPGTDHMQLAYRTECGWCGHVYGANGSDMHERRCPICQQGAPGIDY
jgi:hypothetical protein